MTTARDFITDALGLILQEDITKEVTADDLAKGLTRFNDLLASLTIAGVAISVGELGANDQVNLPREYHRAVKAQLAVDMAPDFGTEVDAQVEATAFQGMSDIRADTSILPLAKFPNGLRRMGRRRW